MENANRRQYTLLVDLTERISLEERLDPLITTLTGFDYAHTASPSNRSKLVYRSELVVILLDGQAHLQNLAVVSTERSRHDHSKDAFLVVPDHLQALCH